MITINTLIKAEIDEINGEGSKLFAIILVDQDDAEDTSIELWKANDENHLFEQVRDEYAGDDLKLCENFENDWNYIMIPKLLGDIINTID